MKHDFAGAWRNIARSPWRSLLSIAIFSLGLTIAGATFALADGVLFKPLPFPSPQRLYIVGPPSQVSAGRPGPVTRAEIDALAQSPQFAGAAAFSMGLFERGYAEQEGLTAARVTSGFFETLGVAPAVGRFLRRTDEDQRPLPIVISHDLYRGRFASDRGLLDRPIRLGGMDVLVVGVAPPEMTFPNLANVWAPMSAGGLSARGLTMRVYVGVVRLPDAGMPEIELNGARAIFLPLSEYVRPRQAAAMALLFGATLLTVVIACGHLMALQLTRLASGARQIAIRLTLGATPSRVARQWTIETALLHAAGLAAAFLLADAVLAVLLRVLPPDIGRQMTIGIDGRTLLFQTLAACLAVLASGALVYRRIRHRTPRLSALAGIGGDSRGARAANALVVGQAVLMTALVYVAMVSLRSYGETMRVDLGVEPDGLYSASLPVDARRAAPIVASLIDELRAHPEVVAVSWGSAPLGSGRTAVTVTTSKPLTIAQLNALERNGDNRSIAPDYLTVAGTPIVAGRGFDADRDALGTVILSESLARAAGAAPGDTVYIAGDFPSRVVGIARDMRVAGPEFPPNAVAWRLAPRPSSTLLVRMRPGAEAGSVVRPIAQRVLATDAPVRIASVAREYERQTAHQRSRALLLGFVAVMSLMLATASLAHLAGDSARRALRDTAVRVALGARPGRLASNLIVATAQKVALGALIGLAGGALAARVVASLLFGVKVIDPLSIALAAGCAVIAAIVAAAPQALRLLRVDTLALLRAE